MVVEYLKFLIKSYVSNSSVKRSKLKPGYLKPRDENCSLLTQVIMLEEQPEEALTKSLTQ